MTWLVLIPTLAYAALNFVKMRAAPAGLLRALAVWAALFAAAAVVLSHLPASLFYPGNAALQALDTELYRLSEKPLKDRDVVIVVEGSSAVAACVKGRQLERLLREKKLPARVVQLSVPGSNHFERTELLREWLARLTPAQSAALRKARVLLLREVLYTYDSKPLSGFSENAFGDRSIAYASPGNLLPMLETSWLASRFPDSEGGSIPLITGHFLFNIFRVGTVPMLKQEKAVYKNRGPAPAPGAAALPPVDGGFNYAAAGEEFRAQLAKPGGKPLPPPYPWLSIHDRELNRVVEGAADQIGWLAPPQLSAYPRRYGRRFLDELDSGAIRFDGGSEAVLAQLDGPEFWKDRVHVTAKGAEVFTRWLADEIAANWPRIAGEKD